MKWTAANGRVRLRDQRGSNRMDIVEPAEQDHAKDLERIVGEDH